MSLKENRSITVKVLGRDYQVACPQDERDALYAAARYLDDRMVAIRKRSAGLGLERIAIMTGLNMARELMHYEKTTTGAPPPPSDTGVIDLGSDPTPAGGGQTALSDDENDRFAQLSLTIKETLQQD